MRAGRKLKNGTSPKSNNRGVPYLRISAGPQRQMYVHRLIAEALLRRRLRPGEEVDHHDGDTLNNDPTNIRVFATATDHYLVTANGGDVTKADVKPVIDGAQVFREYEQRYGW